MRNKIFLTVLLFCVLAVTLTHAANNIAYSVEKIWDNGTYSSFTSLIKYKDRYYCTFREGEGHIFDKKGNAEGKIRVICSKDGKKWESVLLLSEDSVDLRDPKLSETPDGRLMVCYGCSVYRNRVLKKRYPFVVFSNDGKNFGKPQRLNLEQQAEHQDDWLWRVTWHEGIGYGVNYYTHKNGVKGLWLMTTTDGVNYKKHCELFVPNFPNETTIRFLSDGRMTMMVRRDAADRKGWWGISAAPYKDFTFTPMDFQLGGPEYMVLDDHHAIAATRSYFTNRYKTIVLTGDPQTGKFDETMVLPSGGDTSYAGIIKVGNEIWVSYYSCHDSTKPQSNKKSKHKKQEAQQKTEPHASIYLAKIPLSILE